MDSLLTDIMESWKNENGNVNSTEDVLNWIKSLNETTYVNINECSIYDNNMWFYDDYNGEVLNRKRSFFSIKGMRLFVDGEFVSEQPIIVQSEIGYLGIICKKIDGVLNFLMQAKIEPGNVNCVQISPTIQATKSNFTRAHGGSLPTYFELFENSDKYHVIYDQIQSEQSSRFYKKRNRNMIMVIEGEIEIYPNYRWLTLGQIKKMMEIDNLVNMDTRTVLSGLPFFSLRNESCDMKKIEPLFNDTALCRSIFYPQIAHNLPSIYQKLNNYKMFRDVTTVTVPLNQLIDWKIDEYGITCKKQADFMVRYYDIEISGREVQHWMQPLFKAIGMATFGLITKVENGVRKILVKIKPEIGSFDKVEIGPSIQWEASHYLYNDDKVEHTFRNYIEKKKGIMNDVILSEEGGRFYHEQNRNIIIVICEDELRELPQDYVWTDYGTLNYLVQVNNCMNIQLRNLLSIMKL